MVTGKVMVAPRLERTVTSVGAGLTPTCVYDRSPGGAGTPVAIGRAGPISPKPTTVSTADGSLVVMLMSRRARLTRQTAVAPLSTSVVVASLVMVTVVSADEVPQVPGSDHGEQFVTSRRKFRTVPTGMSRPFMNAFTANVMRGLSLAVPKAATPPVSWMRCATSIAPSGVPAASVCHHVKVSGIGDGIVVSRLPDASSVIVVPRVTDCAGPASATGV